LDQVEVYSIAEAEIVANRPFAAWDFP